MDVIGIDLSRTAKETLERVVIGDRQIRVVELTSKKGLESLAAAKADAVAVDIDNASDGARVAARVRSARYGGVLVGITEHPCSQVDDYFAEVLFLMSGGDRLLSSQATARVIGEHLLALVRRPVYSSVAAGVSADGSDGPRTIVFAENRIVLNREKYEVMLDNKILRTTKAEFDVLWLLGRRAGTFHTWRQLIEAAGCEDGDELAVRSHIKRIRRKLGDRARKKRCFIETRYGVGYRVNP